MTPYEQIYEQITRMNYAIGSYYRRRGNLFWVIDVSPTKRVKRILLKPSFLNLYPDTKISQE